MNIFSEIYLDVKQSNIQDTIIAHQYDTKTRYVLCHIIDEGEPIDLTNYDVLFKGYTQDGRMFLEDEVEKQPETGDVILTLSEAFLASSGKDRGELIIYSQQGERLSTMNFTVIVKPSVYSDDRILASENFQALIDALSKVDDAVRIGEELKVLENQIETAENTRNTSENERVENEETRISNEEDRVSAEAIRQQNEINRISSETTRISNEEERIANENARKAAETLRESSENTRIENENTRISNENTRINNEAVRQQTLVDMNEAIEAAETATQNAIEATEDCIDATEEAVAETEIQKENNRKAEELIPQMEEIVDDNNWVLKSWIGHATDENIIGVAGLDEQAKLRIEQFPYDVSTTDEVVDFIENYFENL